MDQRNEDGDGGGDGDDIVDDDEDDSAWVECVLPVPAAGWLIDLLVARIVSPWTKTRPGRTPPQDELVIFPSTIWMVTTMKTMGRHRVRLVMPYLGSPPISCLALGPFTNIKGLQFYRDNDDDPYVTLKEVRTTPHITIHLINM